MKLRLRHPIVPGLLFGLIFILYFGPIAFGQILEQTFREDAAKFQISSPNADWRFTPRTITPGAVRATLRYKTTVDQFTPNVTVSVGLLPDEKWNLDQLIKKDLDDLPEHIKVTEKKSFQHHGHPGFQMKLEDPKNNLVFLQWIFIQNAKTYVITAASRPSTLPLVESDLSEIMQSFKFLKN